VDREDGGQHINQRREQVSNDLYRLRGFLVVLVAEANHLQLPVPANAQELISALDAWRDQLKAPAR
jgi:hypothetical protein